MIPRNPQSYPQALQWAYIGGAAFQGKGSCERDPLLAFVRTLGRASIASRLMGLIRANRKSRKMRRTQQQ